MESNTKIESNNIEIWKDIDGYDGVYQVSNMGRVRSKNRKVYNYIKPGRILKPALNHPGGYLTIGLSNGNKKQKHAYVHRLVAQAFIPNPNNLPQVNHKDFNKKNITVENLEWVTDEDNKSHFVNSRRFNEAKNKKERKLVEKFLVSEYSYKAYCLKQKVEAVKEASRELGCLPVPDRGYINQLKVRKFQDGTDMGSFINYHNYLYKNHQMDPNEESSWKEIFALKERLRKLEFIKRMKELFEIVSKTKSVPKYGYHFQDQTDIGNFISLYKRSCYKRF